MPTILVLSLLAIPAGGCLITRTEAEKVLRVRVAEERPVKGYRGAEICRYTGPADQSLRVELHAGGRTAFESYLKAFRALQNGKAIPVQGLGDQAMFHSSQLTVLKGDAFFVIAIGVDMPDSRRLEESVALARKVIPRLNGAAGAR
jgi:hypothetical protein